MGMPPNHAIVCFSLHIISKTPLKVLKTGIFIDWQYITLSDISWFI